MTSPHPDWLRPDWRAAPNVRAFVTTRAGGVSHGPYASMNTSERVGDAPFDVERNRNILRAALPHDPVWLTQVHGTDVVDAASVSSTPQADASFTRSHRVVCVVQVADCLPVLLADRAGTVVGVVHAGWRGLLAGVLEATIATMAVPAGEIVAWIGPAIGPSAFEVGADVRDAFRADDAGSTLLFATLRAGKWLADLPGLAQRRLFAAGVAHVARDGGCTFTQPERFFSYRRDRHGGRMALAAWLAPAGDTRQ